VIDFQHQTNRLLAEEVLPIEEGWAVRTPSRPEVWMLNHVRVTRPVSYEQAAGLCALHLPEASFDQLYVDEPPGCSDEDGTPDLAEPFRREGWEVDGELHSVLLGEPDRRVATDEVIEPGEDEALALMERWIAEDETLKLTADGLRQLVEVNRQTWRVRQARRLGVREPDGRLAAITLLFSVDGVAQVEDVYTIPEARGRGYGRALVTRAIDLARAGNHELTFIVADDNDWPKELYRRLGFEPVGRTWLFHRQRP
jgi:GNAT superfamily N-acetyltransferase